MNGYGVGVSIFGLIATYRQARDAKNAANEAKTAADEAINQLRTKTASGSISTTVSQLGVISEYINNNNLAAARVAFDVCARNIKDVFQDSDEKLKDLDLNMKEIYQILDLNKPSISQKKDAINQIRDLFRDMTTEEARRKWTK